MGRRRGAAPSLNEVRVDYLLDVRAGRSDFYLLDPDRTEKGVVLSMTNLRQKIDIVMPADKAEAIGHALIAASQRSHP